MPPPGHTPHPHGIRDRRRNEKVGGIWYEQSRKTYNADLPATGDWRATDTRLASLCDRNVRAVAALPVEALATVHHFEIGPLQ